MKLQKRIGSLRFYVAVERVQEIHGICSNLPSGRHVLMWDFDDVSREEVERALKEARWQFDLPAVRVVQTAERGFHAYCFRDFDFPTAVSIVAGTRHVDWNFIKMSVLRGFFTLRFSEKKGRKFLDHWCIGDPALETVKPEDLPCIAVYFTAKP